MWNVKCDVSSFVSKEDSVCLFITVEYIHSCWQGDTSCW